jgi:hypothetical protein
MSRGIVPSSAGYHDAVIEWLSGGDCVAARYRTLSGHYFVG